MAGRESKSTAPLMQSNGFGVANRDNANALRGEWQHSPLEA
jgi:hypothetical protein